jgi:beta-glucoside operon transcriptional antiterminator
MFPPVENHCLSGSGGSFGDAVKNIRKYNNNVILASDNGQEVVVLGKGLGFQTPPGSEVDMALVEKVFVPQKTVQMDRFSGLLSSLPYEYFLLAGKIIDHAKSLIQQPLNQSILFALADHLHFAVKRLKEHMDVQMNLLWDIQHVYPLEFKAGEAALDIIKNEQGIAFPREEAAAIALHFVNAKGETEELPNSIKATALIKTIVSMIEEYFGFPLDEESFDFLRFVTHLRNAILRFVKNTWDTSPEDEDLYFLLKKRHAKAFECSLRICDYLRDTWGWKLTKNDQSFMALHIGRLTEARNYNR